LSRTRLVTIGVVLAVLAIALMGLLLPNRELVPVEFVLWQLWTLPLWGTMALCMVVGAAVAAVGLGFMWALERNGRKRADARARAIELEVTELRRLLARDAATGERGAAAGG